MSIPSLLPWRTRRPGPGETPGTGDAGYAAAADGQAPFPASPPDLVPLPPDGSDESLARQLGAVARHTVANMRAAAQRRARDAAGDHDGVIYRRLAAQPPSVLDQVAYKRSRAWVPPGDEGGMADLYGQEFHTLIGIPAVACGNIVSGLGARPLRAGIFAATAAPIIAICLWIAGLHALVIWGGVVLLLAGLANHVALAALAARRRKAAGLPGPGDETAGDGGDGAYSGPDVM